MIADNVSTKHQPANLGRPGFYAKVIALREIAEQITSLRFLAVSVLAVGLTPLMVYVGSQDYDLRLGEYTRLAALRQDLTAGPAGQEVDGYDQPWTAVNELFVLTALRHPEPLSALVKGVDGALPQYWLFTPAGVEAGPPSATARRLSDLLGHLDLEFLVRVVLGLLAILLAFDAVVGEKERGTLRAVLTFPIPRAAFLTGKLMGGAVTLLVPLTLAYLFALLCAQLFGIDALASENLMKTGLLYCASAAYLLCYYALGLLVSALVRSQKTSLVALLIIWTITVLAVPPLATLLAQVVAPSQSLKSLEEEKKALEEDLRHSAEIEMGAVYREITGTPENSISGLAYENNKEEIDRRIAGIVVREMKGRRRLIGGLEQDAERRAERQNRISRWIMVGSPAAVFANAATELVGTGDADYAAWLRSVREQQSRLNDALFDDPPVVFIRNGGATYSAQRKDSPAAHDLPAFSPPRKKAVDQLRRALPSLFILLFYTALLIVSGFTVFLRYDVR